MCIGEWCWCVCVGEGERGGGGGGDVERREREKWGTKCREEIGKDYHGMIIFNLQRL